MLSRTKTLVAALLAVAALTVGFVACDDDEDYGGGNEGVSAQLEEIQQALATVQLVAALDSLDGAAIHGFDETTIQAETTDDVPAGYLADVRKIRAVVESTSWPKDVQEEVDEILTQSDALEAALTGDDLPAMKEASPEFHAAWHSLREVGYQQIGGAAPAPPEEHEEGEHDAMEEMHEE